ncbi:MAG TPA: IPT/TIG domain-containing protein [Bryobacteraceae bacterium]|nr:IPT/TIG domain-containing protein [Bryobacteraceae bacterium]
MKIGLVATFVTIFLTGAAGLAAFQGFPRCTSVEPETAKTGDTVTAKCENISKTSVSNFYLTDEKDDTKVAIASQTDTEIKFIVPKIKAGRYHLEFLSANKNSLVEQPVVLTVQ